MAEIINFISVKVWSLPMVVLCVVTALLFTFGTKFVQLRYAKEMVRQLTLKDQEGKGLSPFQSLAMSLCGRLGTGNIAGMATAIGFGGPGSVFWMWVISFLGSATAFAESTLGQIYKIKDKDEFRGGPAFYMEKGIGWKWYATLFSIVGILSYALFLPGVQANTITSSMELAFGIPKWVMGLLMSVSLIFVITGGVNRIANISAAVVPIMSVAYIIIAFIVIIVHVRQIPSLFALIFRSAFGLDSVFGGIVGAAINMGIRRGVFTSEAGQGSQVSAAAAAGVSHPAKQGLVQAFSIYICGFFVNTATLFMILLSGKYNVFAGSDMSAELVVNHLPANTEVGTAFVSEAINSVFPGVGNIAVAIAIFFFAYTIFFSYYYIGETNLVYLKSKNGKYNKIILNIFRVVFLLSIFQGSITHSKVAWDLADIGIGLNVWLNLIALLLLYKTVISCFKDYDKQYKSGIDPVFKNPHEIGIRNADFWEEDKK